MFRRLFSRTPTGSNLDALRNAAVAAWIKTVPQEARLDKFLDHLSANQRDEIKYSAKAIVGAAEKFLDDASAGGDIDLSQFHLALHAHLKTRFPWMTNTAFDALRSYTGWYAWHEGY